MACGKLFLIIFAQLIVIHNVIGQKSVIELNEDNWTDILKNEWMVEFYAPWCPACKGLESTWKQYAEQSAELGIKVGKVDVITSPGLSGRFMVTALPTIFHVLNGDFRQYKGSRDKESLISFIEEKKWEHVDPVPGWKSPNSFQMTIVSSFFKLSQYLRELHNKMTEEYGLPTWASYMIFAIATILMGALLGLILVCLLDLIYPPKQVLNMRSQVIEKHIEGKNSDDELADEDIRDDLIDDAIQTEEEKESDSDTEENEPVNNSNKVKKRKARRAD
ncbi:hypothetical protein WA026_020158 [Henosepilachna vigintioctopunctata]|uniref:Thioredoxin domain-containing protein n=1 Tax=Henosepilachna vigintioctopunctata TaxID=420089 RepID=A0AAW1UAK9_9CUCU